MTSNKYVVYLQHALKESRHLNLQFMNTENKIFIARKANNIQADIARGWSSWNFGQEGISCTWDELEAIKAECVENDSPLFISGFELWGNDILNADIRELYEGYWVLVDNETGFGGGIFGVILNAKNLESAIIESQTESYSGEGDRFDASEYELVFSQDDIHIFTK